MFGLSKEKQDELAKINKDFGLHLAELVEKEEQKLTNSPSCFINKVSEPFPSGFSVTVTPDDIENGNPAFKRKVQ